MSLGENLSCQSIIRYPEKAHVEIIYLLQTKSHQSISSGVLSMWPCKKEKKSHPRSVFYYFATPPIKLKLGQQIGGGITNNKPLGPISMSQSKTLSSSQIVFITLFSARCCYVCTSHCNYGESKTIFLNQTGMFWLFFIQICRSYIEHC